MPSVGASGLRLREGPDVSDLHCAHSLVDLESRLGDEELNAICVEALNPIKEHDVRRLQVP